MKRLILGFIITSFLVGTNSLFACDSGNDIYKTNYKGVKTCTDIKDGKTLVTIQNTNSYDVKVMLYLKTWVRKSSSPEPIAGECSTSQRVVKQIIANETQAFYINDGCVAQWNKTTSAAMVERVKKDDSW